MNAAQRLRAHVNEQRRQLAWAAKHLDDYNANGEVDGDSDIAELRIALLKALAGTLEAEEIANGLATDDVAATQAARQ